MKKFFSDFKKKINWKFVTVIYIILFISILIDKGFSLSFVIEISVTTLGYMFLLILAYFYVKHQEHVEKYEEKERQKKKEEEDRIEKERQILDKELFEKFVSFYDLKS